MTDSSRPGIGYAATIIDTPDPLTLARFYADLLGWSIDSTADDWVTIRGDGAAAKLCFQLAVAYTPPTWPDAAVPQQFHLDLLTDDLDAAQAFAETLGAVRRPSAGEEPSFRVFVDPSGHPFCLCQSGGQPG